MINAPVIVIGKKVVRVADRVVIEEVARLSPKVIDIDRPAAHRNRQAHLVLLVSLPVQGQE
jgi:hypothetical protein